MLFNEITKKAIIEAIGKPIELDSKKFESQQARRVLDRLVGYQISPMLWNKVRRGLSAGRVQSVAVRLICEREDEITAFKPQEYWSVEANVEGKNPPPFVAKVTRIDGKKAELVHEAGAREAVEAIRAATLRVVSVERKERKKYAPPPFITSKLQQEASRKLRFSPKRTMSLAQRLYEGVEVGDEGLVGLITYMRTDSTRLSDDAVTDARAYIAERYGAASLPAAPIVYKTKKSAQDAHEAIRPTSLKFDPDKVRQAWSGEKGGGRDARETEDLLKLYTLIWNRFVACQMVPAVFDQTSVDIEAGRVGLRASGQVMKVPGFLEGVEAPRPSRRATAVADDDLRARCPRSRRARSCVCSTSSPSSTSRSRRRGSPRRRWSRSWRRRASAARRRTRRSCRRSRTAATSRRKRTGCTRRSWA